MIRVITPGARTLVQDAGRSGYAHLGIPVSGAADRTALALANRLAGNPDHAAALEVALHGPTLTFDIDAVIAYVGTDADLTLDGNPVPTHHTVPVRAGQTLSVGALRGGVYGYLAVGGGIDSDPVLGSRSTCTLSGLGTAPLAPATVLTVGAAPAAPRYRAARPRATSGVTVRYLPGPHGDLFDAATLTRFEATRWSVSPDASRVGIRLAGQPLAAPAGSIPSLGMVAGAIQVPPTGHPIVLGPDHGTTGGYPVLGTVIGPDLSVLAQRLPGQRVRFASVSVSEALVAEQVTQAVAARSLLDLEGVSA